jgi:hypothetical protein
MYPKRLITAVSTFLLIALFASGLPAQRQRRGGGPGRSMWGSWNFRMTPM